MPQLKITRIFNTNTHIPNKERKIKTNKKIVIIFFLNNLHKVLINELIKKS